MSAIDPTVIGKRQDSIFMLDHRFRHRFTSCLALVQKKRPDFRIFETYR